MRFVGALALLAACASTPDSPAPASGGATAGDAANAGSPSAGGSPAGGGAGTTTSGAPAAGGDEGVDPPTGMAIVYVSGTGHSNTVWAYDLDKGTGALSKRAEFDAGANPSYLALDPARTHLYACNADDSVEGGVTALAIASDGALTLLNHQTGSDGGFAHLALDPSGKFVLAASFGGGSVSVFPIEGDGQVAAQLTSLDFGDNSTAHAIAFDASGAHVLVPTLRLDAIQQLLFSADGMLSANTPAFVATAAGAGPRHLAVHPGGKWALVVNEVDSSVASYALSSEGTLTASHVISTVPEGTLLENTGSHIELSPDGRFVYASNRGHDSIAVFGFDAESGELTLVEHESTRGSTPRDFDLDPSGEVVVVANQESNDLSVYAVEPDGSLTPLGETTPAPSSPRTVQILDLLH